MIAIVWWATAFGGIELELPPMLGEETIVVVTDERGETRPGETVRVVHRPGLAGEREFAVGITDGRGRVRWTPEMPGVARLRAGDEPLEVRVARADPPVGTPLLLGLVGALGLGALAWGLGTGARRS